MSQSWPPSRFHVVPDPPPPAHGVAPPTRGRGRPPGAARRALLTGLVSAGAIGAGAGGWLLAGSVLGSRTTSPARRLSAARPLTYTAIGASDAAGVGVSVPRRDGWVPVFAQQLPQPDGLHPTVSGYRALAGAFAATLREAGVF